MTPEPRLRGRTAVVAAALLAAGAVPASARAPMERMIHAPRHEERNPALTERRITAAETKRRRKAARRLRERGS